MKHFLLALIVASFALNGCVAGGSKKDDGDNDVPVMTDASADDTTSVGDTSATDVQGTNDTAQATDTEQVEDSAATTDTSIEEDATPEEDVAVEDTATSDAPEPPADVEDVEDVPEVVAGCMEEEQEAVQKVNPGKLMEKCETECGVGKTWCIVQCFAQATEVSVECGACFGKTYDCIQDSCAGLCDSLTSESCESCASDNGCFNVLAECVGKNGPPPGNGLCSPMDQEQVENGGSKVDGAMIQCVEECGNQDFGCIEQCVAGKLNVSESCTTCFGMYAACASFQCVEECKEFGSDGCQACIVATGCKAQLQLCVAGEEPGPPTPPEDTACSETDLMVFGALGPKLKDVISNCWEECAEKDDKNCIAKCLKTNTDLSFSCSDCQGAVYQCVYDKCYEPCQNDLDAPECDACVGNTNCIDTTCFGDM